MRRHRLRTARRWAGGLVALVILVAAAPAWSQDGALQEAVAAYEAADFDRAVDLFVALAEDPATETPVRREALQYLGRLYVAQEAFDRARAAVDELLGLEPPLVELDPDVEPPPLMEIYYAARHGQSNSYAVERATPGLRTLAVMDFTNASVDDQERFDPMRQGFASMMINYLQGATALQVVERERIQWLLDELALQRDPNFVDQATAVRTGQLLGATAVLFGSFTVHRRDMLLTARLVNVETGEILLAEQVMGRHNDFFRLVEQLSAQVAEAIDVELADAGEPESSSLDAVLAYSQGLALIEEERYQEAYAKFIEALDHDPSYARARQKAESIRPLLG